MQSTPALDRTPLECFNLSGYRFRLLTWMIAPPVIAATIALAIVVGTCFSRTRHKADASDAADAPPQATFFELVTPWLLRVFFIMYPLITNVAFEAWPVMPPTQAILRPRPSHRAHMTPSPLHDVGWPTACSR